MEAYLTHVFFSTRHSTTFLHLGMLDSPWALHLKAIWNSKSLNKSTKIPNKQSNKKPMALNRPQKGQLFTVQSWNRKAEHRLAGSQLGTCALWDSNYLPLCACPQMATRVLQVLMIYVHINIGKWGDSPVRISQIVRLNGTFGASQYGFSMSSRLLPHSLMGSRWPES